MYSQLACLISNVVAHARKLVQMKVIGLHDTRDMSIPHKLIVYVGKLPPQVVS